MKKITIELSDEIYKILLSSASTMQAKKDGLTIEEIATRLIWKQLKFISMRAQKSLESEGEDKCQITNS